MTSIGIQRKLEQLMTVEPFFSLFFPQTIRIKKEKTISDLVMSVHSRYFIKTFSILKTFGFTNKLD